MKVIVCDGFAIPWMACADEGKYLEFYDPDQGAIGVGMVIWTDNIDDALKFETFSEAAEVWRAVSFREPIRPDGKPNRPLTAYTIIVQDVK